MKEPHISRRVVNPLLGLFGILVIVLGANPVSGQEQSARKGQVPQVFCEEKSAGQLCGHGTVGLLRLEGVKKKRWEGVVRQYNTAVDAAQKQLLAEAEKILSLEEYARVQKWFARSVNAQLNRQLLGTR